MFVQFLTKIIRDQSFTMGGGGGNQGGHMKVEKLPEKGWFIIQKEGGS